MIDEEVIAYTSMTETDKEVTAAIKESTHVTRFSPETLMGALVHLLDNKTPGLGTIGASGLGATRRSSTACSARFVVAGGGASMHVDDMVYIFGI